LKVITSTSTAATPQSDPMGNTFKLYRSPNISIELHVQVV